MKILFEKLNIRNKDDFIRFIIQFIKFGIVGLSNTIISLSIYYVFIFINKDFYIVGNTVGFVVSVLNAYYWNNRYVFKKEQTGHMISIIKTFTAYGFTFILGTVLLVIMVKYLGVSKIIAPILNLIITIPLNFILNKFWAFK